jgi:TonB family protein
MTSLRIWPFLWVISLPALCLASANDYSSPSLQPWSPSLAAREQQLWKPAIRDARFTGVPHTNVRSCEASNPPEALATPNPLLDIGDLGKVTVSFIVGTDGKVHSPLILISAGQIEDRTVLETVRSWRYRPATCNGTPTETEGKIEFSSR